MSAITSGISQTPEGAERELENQRDAARGEPPYTPAPSADSRLAASLKDAAMTAAVVAVLTVFFFAFRTDIAVGGLNLTFRWPLWLSWVAIAFAGRFLISYFLFRAPERAVAGVSKSTSVRPAKRFSAGKIFGIVMLLAALALPFILNTLLPSHNRYLLDLAILILTYVMLGWGLNIVVGLAGLLDLGYVAFYAVGAYSFALLAQNFELGFWVCLPMAGFFAAMWGIVLGFPVLRLRGDYLAIVTLAFGEIIRVVLLNWTDFTGGPNGLLGIPKPTLFGLEFKSGAGSFAEATGIPYSPIQRFIFLYYIILALALLTNFITLRLRKLPIGRAWEALREDEIACRSLGINTTNVKLSAFATGAMFGGFAGSFFATRQGFISPESFTFIESAIILAIVVLGGLGSQVGVVIASVVMIGGIELLRNLGFLHALGFDPTEYRMLIFGLAMIAIMVWKPRGLVSSRSPSAIYKEKKKIGADLVAQGEGH
ncbi:high-affinity branched-chain amino acid ABC transporter permease LivM [Mangrovicella endophytica]|uniref:high-affinity branched-chain amino acid ABC transporter permease LivM n=1 Tax=Mangrovicella endophytica TaxID=2066697 RepID=UPI000C9DDAF5|nr:high-affinity branched-chain amino acid ABC transporter permease LivM [Mangrovicella endophytica]